MILGEMVAVVAEFVRRISGGDYESALAMCQRHDGATQFRESLRSLFGDLVDDIGEMPLDGWQELWVLGPADMDDQYVLVDAPVWDTAGRMMDWFFKFALMPGQGEEWQIDYVTASY